MERNPTYEELLSDNRKLKQKLAWLEGVYHNHRDAGEQVKDKFLSNMSHEIRTPMNSILGFANLLNDNRLTEDERNEYLYYITHSSRTLLKVLDNMIDLSLLETKGLKMRREEVYAEDLFKEIYEFFNSRVVRTMHYRIALLMTTPTQYGRITLEVDGYRLKRIIENLISSALNHQVKGVIEMRMDVQDEKRIVFTVISSKNELLEERAKMIFENNGSTDDWHNQLDATGLSYKLARDLAQAMGGSVSLKQVSEKRMGISVDLPIKHIGYIKKKRVA